MDPVVDKIVEVVAPPLTRQICYIFNYNDNFKKMTLGLQKLDGKRASVQHTVDEAIRNGEEIENLVYNWLNKAANTVADANKLLDTEDHAKVQCSMGHCPNPITRHQMSRKMTKMIQEISEVIAEGEFDRISYRAASKVTVTPFSRGYEALDSRTSMLHEIMMDLKNPNISIIGVCGMGGVGKTTLVNELAWQAENDEFFNAVVVATISDPPNLEKIQSQLADSLDMKFTKETIEGRARELRDRISKEKSILVILDDIWGRIDLTELGVPYGNDHKGCKLVAASRNLNVLNCEMRTQKEFKLEVLLEEDSWKLFEKTAGDVVQDFNIKPVAVEVSKCCVGLPLLIVRVAKALRKKPISDWKDALNELKRFDQEGLHKKVYSTLELSYNCLESEELKLLFLFIGSFGKSSIATEKLFSYSWGFGLFRHSHTLTAARVKFNKLLNDLEASSLLLDLETERGDLVRMHDVVRDVANSIASRTWLSYVVDRLTKVKQWPDMDELRKCHQIIVHMSIVYKLPEKLECPELKLLQLENVGDVLEVPDDFFSEMMEVKVMLLCGMILTPSPPPSLCLLTKLQTLELYRCVLQDISIVAELKSLEILKLERSDITELPREIGQLTNLRMLNLNHCSALRFIPANLISSLKCLEELYMRNCFIQWDVKGSKDQSNRASLDELGNLSHLTALDIIIQDASNWPRDLQMFEKLERYNILVGDMWKWTFDDSSGDDPECSRILKLKNNMSSCILLDRGFNFLLNSAEDMCLAKIQTAKKVIYDLNREGLPQLKHLRIQDSTELKYIIDSMGLNHPNPALTNLKSLHIIKLFDLEEICHGPVPIQSFTELRVLNVKSCQKLKNLFWYSHVGDLPQLASITVDDCQMMTEIIAVQTSDVDKEIDRIILPQLYILELKCLPSLISFYGPSTQCIPVALIDQKVVMPNLEILTLSKINSRKLWDDKLPVPCIQNLTSLTINKCGSIAYAFSSSVARELVNLRSLDISNCPTLEEIIVSDGKLGSLPSSQKPFSNEVVIFPNLIFLEISHMEHLKSVWHDHLAPNSFCKLESLKIKFCNKISNLFPSDVLDKLQNLKSVTVTDCPALEVVFDTQGLKADGVGQTRLEMQIGTLILKRLPMLKHIWSGIPNESFNFPNLCTLVVFKCESLNYVFPLSVAKELQHLQELCIEECGMEIIVAQDEMAGKVPILLLFPELTSLTFHDLEQLRSFYHGLHTLDCPALSNVDVLHCDKLELFTPRSLNDREIVPDDKLPVLSIEKVVTNTSKLILNCKDVTMLCNGQLNDELMYKVKALHLRCFHDESEKFPSSFLQRFINLEFLRLACSSFSEIFSIGSIWTGHSETTMTLRRLVLADLKNLEFICREKSEAQQVLQNIEILEVHMCSSLKNIFPSNVLFENLVQLDVQDCAGLKHIMKSSVATSLPKLKGLRIVDCEKIEEIVASDDDNDASEIIFMNLLVLKLKNLPRLRSFCKGRHGFKFPKLNMLVAEDCPMMETFSHGVLHAPMLLEVIGTVEGNSKRHWKGDINTTIRKFLAKKNDYPQNLNESSSR